MNSGKAVVTSSFARRYRVLAWRSQFFLQGCLKWVVLRSGKVGSSSGKAVTGSDRAVLSSGRSVSSSDSKKFSSMGNVNVIGSCVLHCHY